MIKKNWKQFRKKFFEQCCCLICEAKTNIKPKYLYSAEYKGPGIKKEDYITDEYIKRINDLANSKDLKVFALPEVRQENIISKDNRGNPDITFFSVINLEIKTCFECKILGSNSKYIQEGIKRFVSGKYVIDPKMKFYGMFGYVEKETASSRYLKLQTSMKKKGKDVLLKSENKNKNNKNEVIFNTEHGILNGKKDSRISIYHILHSWEK